MTDEFDVLTPFRPATPGRPLTGLTVLAVEDRGSGWVTLQVELDEAVDVVVFDGFSNFRKRVRAEVGPKGHSEARLSDGTPHLQIRL